MSRYIDAYNLIKKMQERYNNLSNGDGFYDHFTQGYEDALSTVENEPTADVQEVKHGKWTIRYEDTYKRAKCYCSVCGKPNGIGGIISNQKKPYCPNCGAKMDLEDKE